jgi:hypothetical protein
MKDSVEMQIQALTKKAKKEGVKLPPDSSRSRSSLHQIIKTKEQADRFMKLLRSL